MTAVQTARYFSRQGYGLLRIPQESGPSFQRDVGPLLSGSAFLLSIIGVGMSLFSMKRMHESCNENSVNKRMKLWNIIFKDQ